MRILPCSFLLLLTILVPATSQDLTTILENHYKASEVEKMQKVETLITTGKTIYSSTGFESAFTICQARPDKLRIVGDYQGSQVIQTYNGTTGWKYAPAMGIPEPVELIGLELEMLLNQAFFENPLWNYSAMGSTLENGLPEGEGTHHLILTTSKGEVSHFYIDRSTYLISSLKTSQIMGGSETAIEIQMKDYRSVRGIPFAFQVVTRMNGQVLTTLQIENVDINREVAPGLFEKPSTE
jgi:hypothetical protein